MVKPTNLVDTLKEIEDYITSQTEAIQLGEELKLLKKNPLFKTVILDGYIEVEAKKLFKILTDPTNESGYSNEVIEARLASIRDFKRYIGTDEYDGTVTVSAKSAPSNIAREQDFRTEITANAVDGDS